MPIFCSKFTRNKVVVPKGNISADTWRITSWGTDRLELICEKAERSLNVDAKNVYHDKDLYHKNWKMLDTYQLIGEVGGNEETFSGDLVWLTKNWLR